MKPRYVYLSDAKASHSHKMWTEISSPIPHFLHVGLLLSPIIYRCLLKVLCPVSRPITTLDCVLLKDSKYATVARLWTEINSQAWVYAAYGSGHKKQLPQLYMEWLLFVDSVWLWAMTTQSVYLLATWQMAQGLNPNGGGGQQNFLHLSGPALGST